MGKHTVAPSLKLTPIQPRIQSCAEFNERILVQAKEGALGTDEHHEDEFFE